MTIGLGQAICPLFQHVNSVGSTQTCAMDSGSALLYDIAILPVSLISGVSPSIGTYFENNWAPAILFAGGTWLGLAYLLLRGK